MLQPTALLWQRAPLSVLLQLTALLVGALQPAALQLRVRQSAILQPTALLWQRAPLSVLLQRTALLLRALQSTAL